MPRSGWLLLVLMVTMASTGGAASLPYGSGPGQVGFINGHSHPDQEEPLPLGPLAFRVHGNELWVADSVGGRVLRCDLGGRILGELPVTKTPGCLLEDLNLALDHRGRVESVWVLEGGQQEIIELSPAGAVKRRIGGAAAEAGGFVQIHRIEIGASGRLYVADKGRQAISVFEPDGRFNRERRWEWSGFALDPRENLCLLEWDASAGAPFLRREDGEGRTIDRVQLDLPPHTSAQLWWITRSGTAAITYRRTTAKEAAAADPGESVPPADTGQPAAGTWELGLVSVRDGRTVRTMPFTPPLAMNRFIDEADGRAVWLGVANYALAPAGRFEVKRVPWR